MGVNLIVASIYPANLKDDNLFGYHTRGRCMIWQLLLTSKRWKNLVFYAISQACLWNTAWSLMASSRNLIPVFLCSQLGCGIGYDSGRLCDRCRDCDWRVIIPSLWHLPFVAASYCRHQVIPRKGRFNFNSFRALKVCNGFCRPLLLLNFLLWR